MIKPESQVSDGKPIGVWHTYNSSRGLKISAYKLLQDRAGYLWIGAHPPGGLCRYDGVEFSYFSLQDGFLGLQLEFLFEDSRGRLWVCTNDPDRPAGLVEFRAGAGAYIQDGLQLIAYREPGDEGECGPAQC